MDETERVLERLRRIRELDDRQASSSRVLHELRELVREAEAWARLEGDERAAAAASELAGQVARAGEVQPESMALDRP